MPLPPILKRENIERLESVTVEFDEITMDIRTAGMEALAGRRGMKIRTERLENDNLRVHLPVTLRCRGGRRHIMSGKVPLTLTAMRLSESIPLDYRDEQERELLGE